MYAITKKTGIFLLNSVKGAKKLKKIGSEKKKVSMSQILVVVH